MINQSNKIRQRVGCFGASDTHFIMGNWDTSTFINWWQSKLGTKNNNFSNTYTLVGTYKEHQIADWYEQKFNVKLRRDRKHKVPFSKIIINYDCETKTKDVEIKTYKITNKEWVCPKNYWQQVQVQMYGGKKTAEIVAYGLVDADYDNFYLPIEESRINVFPVAYDAGWIINEYLPKERYLEWCLKKRKTPRKLEFEKRKIKYEKNKKN